MQIKYRIKKENFCTIFFSFSFVSDYFNVKRKSFYLIRFSLFWFHCYMEKQLLCRAISFNFFKIFKWGKLKKDWKFNFRIIKFLLAFPLNAGKEGKVEKNWEFSKKNSKETSRIFLKKLKFLSWSFYLNIFQENAAILGRIIPHRLTLISLFKLNFLVKNPILQIQECVKRMAENTREKASTESRWKLSSLFWWMWKIYMKFS